MSNNKITFAILAGVSSLALCHRAMALEFYSPMQPGVSTGVPAGALPPPGLYGGADTFLETGPVENGKGHQVAKTSGANITPQLLYVPGWQVLGANYGMMINQPFNFNSIKVGAGATPSAFTGYGMFNTILTPEILSWALGHGNFIAEGMTFYIPDGDFRHTGTSETLDSVSNNYWTFEPNIAYSYLGNGWNFTLNNTFDFNTKDNTTDYQSGDVYYLDYTIAHAFGPITAGLIGTYDVQFTNDTQFGAPVANTGGSGGYGNKWMHAAIGPILEYNIGHATIELRYLDGFAGRNGGNPSFFHFGINFPIM
ncbi:transporter [Acidocella sp.]|uniref:SphA family protein n=1 Tax=Acidocella sp. TaxID=50710 RepID=UPI00261BA309|nr:transporter [Acidocella sp.]